MSKKNSPWSTARLQQLNLLLWGQWDPIGGGVPLDEYASYVWLVAGELQRGADVNEIADLLEGVRTGPLGSPADRLRDEEAAAKIVEWFSTDEHPGFSSDADV
ncbi:MAG TPA: hypothetical protein VFL41_08265 [Gaiellaceae bacterium]|nr:hypothetical protein [Gaiellaceae bacterium]